MKINTKKTQYHLSKLIMSVFKIIIQQQKQQDKTHRTKKSYPINYLS